MTVKETTEQANLIRLRQVVEEIGNANVGFIRKVELINELKNLSGKRYPVTDEWILWNFEKEDHGFVTDDIRKTHTHFAHYVLRENIDEICYKFLHNFSYGQTISKIEWMVTETSLRAPKINERGGFTYVD